MNKLISIIGIFFTMITLHSCLPAPQDIRRETPPRKPYSPPKKPTAVQTAGPQYRIFRPLYANFFTFINDYPSDRNTDWTGDLQGVAHDDQNWFFTQGIEDVGDWLLKFPITYDLNRGVSSGALSMRKPSELRNYWHYGDLVEHKGFLFVPMLSSRTGFKPIIAVFRSSDLSFVDLAEARENNNLGWCAINLRDGLLYTSNENISDSDPIIKYRVDFKKLIDRNDLSLEFAGTFKIFDECHRSLTLKSMQGGELSPDGSLLFLTNGYFGVEQSEEGLMAFDSESGDRVERSTWGYGLFNYEFHPSYYEEPEGLTVWDLDADTRAPNIRGQLHVIMLDNDAGNEDDLYFKHYRVDRVTDLAEDIVPFDYRRAEVRPVGRAWEIGVGREQWFRFNKEAEARQALRILQHHRINSVGYVGRPQASMTYLLSDGRAPAGPFAGEDSTAFDPSKIRVERETSSWRIVLGINYEGRQSCEFLLSFGDNEEREARAAYKIMKKYGFDHICYIGRPNASLVYFRK